MKKRNKAIRASLGFIVYDRTLEEEKKKEKENEQVRIEANIDHGFRGFG